MSTRFVPSIDLDIGGAVLVELDLLSCDLELCVTDSAPTISMTLNDINRKFSGLPFHWNDAIVFGLNEATRFLGRIDSLTPDYDKKGARILSLKGRHTGSAALQDYVANLQVSGTPHEIVEAIISRYMTMRGSTYTNDPEITIKSNLAPEDITMAFDWRRKNFWKMLDEVQQALGAPEPEGGKDEFYDFYFDPATLGDFYFAPMGTNDSEIVITESVETLKAKRILDGNPLKNTIYLWCNASAGTIPLEMQTGWNEAQDYDPPVIGVTDPWTEGNAADYDLFGDPFAAPSAHPEDEDDPRFVKVGEKSIYIKGPTTIGIIAEHLSWYLTFPKDGIGVKWPAQDPGGHFNTCNEESLSDERGEFSLCRFWIKAAAEFDIMMQCKDSAGVYAFSQSYHYNKNWLPSLAADWVHLALPFGPSANWSVVAATNPPPVFNWADIEQIAWVTIHTPFAFGTPEIWFDGLEFIKPLIANASYISGIDREKTLRSIIVPKEKIIDYPTAKLIAEALLEQQKHPNVYWSIENLGRSDIPSGSKFKIGDLEILMREQRWNMTKEGGWTITATALEQT